MSLADVSEGQQLEPLVIESVDPERMKTMAAILQDPNPIHFDRAAAAAAGLGDRVVNQGPINMSYLANLVVAWAGTPDALKSFSVRFLGNVLEGDRVECSGKVVSVDHEAGEAELELTASVGDDAVLSGSAVVRV